MPRRPAAARLHIFRFLELLLRLCHRAFSKDPACKDGLAGMYAKFITERLLHRRRLRRRLLRRCGRRPGPVVALGAGQHKERQLARGLRGGRAMSMP